jgi:hypothetical protein
MAAFKEMCLPVSQEEELYTELNEYKLFKGGLAPQN